MFLGARIIKSALAVVLSLYIAELLEIDSLAFVAITAFLAVEPSVYRSWKHLLRQLQANFIGAVVAVSFVHLFGNSPIIVGLAILLLLSAHVSLKQYETLAISALTVIAIMEIQDEQLILFALERFGSITLGIICAVFVNVFFFPPKYEHRLFELIQHSLEKSSIIVRNIVLNQLTPLAIKETLDSMKEDHKKIDELYEFHIEHFKDRLHRHKLSEKKKTIIIKKMMTVLKKEALLINTFQEHRVQLQSLAPEILHDIQQHLYLLTNYEEKILLKFTGQVQPHFPCELNRQVEKSTRHLLSFLEDQQNDFALAHTEKSELNYKEKQMPFVILFSTIFELSEHLILLDRYVDSFSKTQHKKPS